MGRRTLFGRHRNVPAPCLAVASSLYVLGECTCGPTLWCMESLSSWSGVRTRLRSWLMWQNLLTYLCGHLLGFFCGIHGGKFSVLLSKAFLSLFAPDPILCWPVKDLLLQLPLSFLSHPCFPLYLIIPISTRTSTDVTHLKRISLAPTFPSSCHATICPCLKQNASKELSVLSVPLLPPVHSKSQTHGN